MSREILSFRQNSIAYADKHDLLNERGVNAIILSPKNFRPDGIKSIVTRLIDRDEAVYLYIMNTDHASHQTSPGVFHHYKGQGSEEGRYNFITQTTRNIMESELFCLEEGEAVDSSTSSSPHDRQTPDVEH